MTNYSYSNEYVGQLIDMLYKVKNCIPEDKRIIIFEK